MENKIIKNTMCKTKKTSTESAYNKITATLKNNFDLAIANIHQAKQKYCVIINAYLRLKEQKIFTIGVKE